MGRHRSCIEAPRLNAHLSGTKHADLQTWFGRLATCNSVVGHHKTCRSQEDKLREIGDKLEVLMLSSSQLFPSVSRVRSSEMCYNGFQVKDLWWKASSFGLHCTHHYHLLLPFRQWKGNWVNVSRVTMQKKVSHKLVIALLSPEKRGHDVPPARRCRTGASPSDRDGWRQLISKVWWVGWGFFLSLLMPDFNVL